MNSILLNSQDEVMKKLAEILSFIKGADAMYLRSLTLKHLSLQIEGEYFVVVNDNGHSRFYSNMSTIYTIENMKNIDLIISVCVGGLNSVTIIKQRKAVTSTKKAALQMIDNFKVALDYMKESLQNDNIPDALSYASGMINDSTELQELLGELEL